MNDVARSVRLDLGGGWVVNIMASNYLSVAVWVWGGGGEGIVVGC